METHIVLSSLRRAVQSAEAYGWDMDSLTLWVHGPPSDDVGFLEVGGVVVEIRRWPTYKRTALLGEPFGMDGWNDIPVETR